MGSRSFRGVAVAIALIAGTGAASLAVAAVPAGATAPKSITYSDTCSYVVSTSLGSQSGSGSFAVTAAATAPASVAPGAKVTLTAVEFSVTIPASLIQKAISYGATNIISPSHISTLDIAANDTTKATANVNVTKTAFTIPSVALSKYKNTGYTLNVPKTPASKSGWVAGSTAGTMNFTPGKVALTVTFKDSLVGTATAKVTCAALPVSSTDTIASTTVS